MSSSCSADGPFAPAARSSLRVRATKAPVIDAVVDCQESDPEEHHDRSHDLAGGGLGNVIAVTDRRHGLDGPPEP